MLKNTLLKLCLLFVYTNFVNGFKLNNIGDYKYKIEGTETNEEAIKENHDFGNDNNDDMIAQESSDATYINRSCKTYSDSGDEHKKMYEKRQDSIPTPQKKCRKNLYYCEEFDLCVPLVLHGVSPVFVAIACPTNHVRVNGKCIETVPN